MSIQMHMRALHAYVFMYMCMDIFDNVFSSESTILYITLTKILELCLCSSLGAAHKRDPLLRKLATTTNSWQHITAICCVWMMIVCLPLPDILHMLLQIFTIGVKVCIPIPNIQVMIISNVGPTYTVKKFMPICTNSGLLPRQHQATIGNDVSS